MGNPRIKIEKTSQDKLIEGIGWSAVLAMIGLSLYYFKDLPENIPSHFNLKGEADSFYSKNIIWILPIIGTLAYIFLNSANKYPHLFNFPQKVTKENAETLYTIGLRMMRVMNTIVAFSLLYIVIATIRTSLGYQEGLGNMFPIAFLLIMIIPILYFTQEMKKAG